MSRTSILTVLTLGTACAALSISSVGTCAEPDHSGGKSIHSQKSRMPSKVARQVTTLIIEHLDADPAKVIPSANLQDDLGADDLDAVELIMAMEEEFHIKIPEADAGRIQTVGDAIRYVEDAVKHQHKSRA